MAEPIITLAHGSGGQAMHELLDREILRIFGGPHLSEPLEDQARLPLDPIRARGDRLAFTTDSFVIDPIEFPGGNIGSLAVNGTVNDLAVGGALPLYLTCGLIIEEGLPLPVLRRILSSMREAADRAGVGIVSGDTKVVPKGAADRLFINTAGVGVIPEDRQISAGAGQPGDVVLVNGPVGNHGAAILAARDDFSLELALDSDCRALNAEIEAVLKESSAVHCLRDATRGGIAAVLNEFALGSRVRIMLEERAVPLCGGVRGICELLGLNPLHLANEGKFIALLPAAEAEKVLPVLRRYPGAEEACVIGRVEELGEEERPGVTVKTRFGGERLLDIPIGDPLPRIC